MSTGIAEKGFSTYEDKHIKAKGIFASEDFFNVFSYASYYREIRTRCWPTRTVLLYPKVLAKKIFNTTDNIIGKTFAWNQRMRFEGPAHISGIFKDLPANSTKQFDIVFNFKKLIEGDKYAAQWNAGPAETYLVLKKGTDINEFNKKISGYLLSKDPDNKSTLFVSRYSGKYLHGHFENGVQAGGRIEYVWLFSIIALFILAIACINFMNLSTAQASRKMKEIGVKKTMGINRKALIIPVSWRINTHGFFIAGNCGHPGCGCCSLNSMSLQISAYILPLAFTRFYLYAGIVLFTGIVSGCYPAFYLSGFDPAKS